MIARLWHGWTKHTEADTYEELLKTEVLPGIERQAPGYKGVLVLRRRQGDEVEFVTLTLWESVDTLRDFIGEDYEAAYVPVEAQRVLSSYDARSEHYELIASVGMGA